MKIDSIIGWLEPRAGRIAIGTATAIFTAGVIYSHWLGPDLRYYDEGEYLELARNLVDVRAFTTDGSTLTARRPPGYPGFLALLLHAGASIELLRVANYACLAASIWLLYVLGRRLAGPAAGALSAVLAAMYPVFFYAAGTLYPQIVSATLLLAIVAIVTRPDPPPSFTVSALAGLLFGLLILSVPTFVFSLTVVGGWLLIGYRKHAVTPVLGLAVVAALVLGGWQLRNYRVFGAFVFVSTNSGVNLLLGNSENATSDSGVNGNIEHYYEQASGLGEVERDHYFRDSALRWMSEHPGDAIALYAGKWLHYFSYRDKLATRSEASRARELLMLLSYGPLLVCLLARLALRRRLPIDRIEALLIALYLLNSFFMALFFTRIRFRIPMDHLLVVLAAVFLVRLAKEWLAPGALNQRTGSIAPASDTAGGA